MCISVITVWTTLQWIGNGCITKISSRTERWKLDIIIVIMFCICVSVFYVNYPVIIKKSYSTFSTS